MQNEYHTNNQKPTHKLPLSLIYFPSPPFGIKRQKPKRLQVEAGQTSHEERPQTEPSHHLYPHQPSAGKLCWAVHLPDPQYHHVLVK